MGRGNGVATRGGLGRGVEGRWLCCLTSACARSLAPHSLALCPLPIRSAPILHGQVDQRFVVKGLRGRGTPGVRASTAHDCV